MKKGESKYNPEMNQKAYNILASGGTHARVCTELGISEETLCQWLGRGKYKNSRYVKRDLSEHIKKGELAGKAWLDDEIRKAATQKFEGNPTLLIFMTKRRDFIPRAIPEFKDGTYQQKIDAITDLYNDGVICLESYENMLTCIEKRVGIMDKVKLEEVGKKVEELTQQLQELQSAGQGN